MKALQLVTTGQPLKLKEVPLPGAGPRDVLVRVMAAGICHSDVHYRNGASFAGPLPITLGHEVAGVVEQTGADATGFAVGDRVCIHYLATCGNCRHCQRGQEQFCETGAMLGKHRDGGFAEYVLAPARSLVALPKEIPFTQGAVMMCSSATALHALNKARLKPGETVAVFGIGGLGISAVQLARAFGALTVFAVDIQRGKLALASHLGATPVNASQGDPVAEIRRLTAGRGVDVAIELIGLPLTMRQAVQVLAIQGRAALAGITPLTFEVAPYMELLNREAEIIGVSDHLSAELPLLLELARVGKLDLAKVITRTIPLEAAAVNETLDRLEEFGEDVRVVITPG